MTADVLILNGKEIKDVVDGDWQRGIIFVRLDAVTRIFERPRGEENFVVAGNSAGQVGIWDMAKLGQICAEIDELELWQEHGARSCSL